MSGQHRSSAASDLEPFVAPRILLVRLGAIGDVVNALIVANGIRHHLPAATIGWAVHPLSKPLLEGHPAVDRIHVWKKGDGLRGFRGVVREVRDSSYDVALDLQRLQKSALLARFSGAPRVLGFDRGRAKEQSWLWTKERILSGHPREHMVLQYQRFLDLLGLPRAPLLRTLATDSESEAWAVRFVAEACGGAAPILLNIGASKPEKLWPEASFRALAPDLERDFPDVPVVVTGGPQDVQMGRALGQAVSKWHVLTGETSLRQLTALLSLSRGMVTGDTGAMHMAAALSVPTVAIFGPSDPLRTGPFGRGHVILQGGEPVALPASLSCLPPRVRCPMAATSPAQVSFQMRQSWLR
ncbi:ADP-heptose--LPS heptosyltransferase 2 [Planctomycetes bacterium Poly30]|uniref:ADP-heptose--LPS heptosyltransferase 2 n=1 Tax=Saltatorellus ferox TaxID=2528018 RepID=A0A518EQH6_9BACT|nr:ADP-heptose--LPS heptosyltransferase 2 [Planctomycetes bacterium Poly30]